MVLAPERYLSMLINLFSNSEHPVVREKDNLTCIARTISLECEIENEHVRDKLLNGFVLANINLVTVQG